MFNKKERENTPQNGEDAHRPRHIHRGEAENGGPVEVDSSAFFAEDGEGPEAGPAEPPQPEAGDEEPDIERTPRLGGAPKLNRNGGAGAPPPKRPPERDEKPEPEPMPKRGGFMLVLQAILSVAALVQLWRTQMLPVRYLIAFAVLLLLFWFVVSWCQRWRVSGVVARVFSIVLCAALALGCVWAQQGLSALNDITSGLLTGSEANKITKEPFVVYLSGVDTRSDSAADAASNLSANGRSDVNILAVVNPTTKRVALINTPRDYYVDLAGTSSKDKLTHAGLYGVETSMATLGQLYNVDVTHYIRINFEGFIGIVDAIGGVDVYSDYAFTSVGSPGYYDPTTFVEGWNHLDGKAALAFARERHAFATGDVQRGINQMKVIDAMLNKIKSPALLVGFSKLLDTVSNCFVTSLSSEQISALVRMQLNDLAEWDIQSYTVTGSGAKSTKCYSAQGQNLYVMMPDEASVNEARALIQSVLGGEAGEGSASSYSSGEIDAYSATGDPNAGTPSVDETPDEPEIELPAESVVEEAPASSEAASEQAPEASASTELPAESAPAESAPTAGGSESSSIALPSESEVEQAASSIADVVGGLLDALAGAANSEGANAAADAAA